MKSKTPHSLPILLVLFIAQQAHAIDRIILYVDDSAPDGGSGLSWDSPFRHVQDCLALARELNGAVKEIRVGHGTYRPDESATFPDGSGDQHASFELVNGVALRGGYAGYQAPDPDLRDIDLFETRLSGSLSDFCTGEIHHIVTSTDNTPGTILDGFMVQCAENQYEGGCGLQVVGGTLAVIDCTFCGHFTELGNGAAATVNNATALFHSCVFHDNSVYEEGNSGGLLSENSFLTVIDCEFIHNGFSALECAAATNAVIAGCTFADATLSHSGPSAMRNENSDVLISNCHVFSNDDEGSPIANAFSTVSFRNCLFEDNIADFGGALNNFESDVQILDSQFINNYSEFSSGAIRNSTSTLAVHGCAFIGNWAGEDGGAFDNLASTVAVANSVFIGNGAENTGGVGRNENSMLEAVNCAFLFNSTFYFPRTGGSVFFNTSDSTLNISNSIIWMQPPDIMAGPGVVTINYSNVEGGWPGAGENNISVDPMFVVVSDPGQDGIWGNADDNAGNLRLLPGSPCIDAGDNTAVPLDEFDLDNDGDTTEPIPFDLAGLPRFVDDPKTVDTGNGLPPIVDMGAYEFTGTVNPLDLTGDGVVDAADLAQLLADWGACPGCPADLDGDGTIDADDLAELLANWG